MVMLLTYLQVKEHVCCGRCGTILPVVIMIIGVVIVYINVVPGIRMTGRKRMVLAASATNQAIMITNQPLMNTPLIVLPVRLLEWMVSATPPPVRAVTQKYWGFASKVILLLQTSLERPSFSVATESS